MAQQQTEQRRRGRVEDVRGSDRLCVALTPHELVGTPCEYVWRMDDKLRNAVDENDETSDSAEEGGPLDRLLEHWNGSSAAESERATLIPNKPSQPSTASTDYAEGTREHDDDREG